MSVEDFTSRSYDYVICGGGTAGLVVAARLTEDPEVTVAVLEAGKNRLGDLLVDCPGMFPQLSGNPEYDWRYKTVPQEGTHDRVHYWVRGKALGGSSAINWQMFSHASRQDLDNWAELGCEGWSYASLSPYYRKFESYYPCSDALGRQLDDKYIDKSLRGTSGPIKICFPETDVNWVQDLWPKTVAAAGYEPTMDPRTGSAIGAFNQLNTIDPVHKRRSYAAREYYEPNANRPNLSVLTDALVSKIELKTGGSDAKATGVSFIVNGSHYTVKGKKEVIVCGGTIGSPQILELSGIGSPEVLKKAGVDVIVDLPSVGENLSDHTASGLIVGVKDEFPTGETLLRNPDIMQQAMDAYTQHKSGPFVGAPTGTGFASLEKIQPNFTDAEQHIQSIITDYEKKHPNRDLAGRDALLARQLLDPKEAVCQFGIGPAGANLSESPEKMFPCSEEGNWMVIGVCSTRSLSRGSVHIHSADPNDHPMINPAYYSHPLDLDMMARAFLHSISFLEIEPLRSVVRRDANGVPILNKDARGILPKTLEEAKEYLRAATVTEYHCSGSNAMLPIEKGGVVDPASMKVYGTSNIRVIDASIFPLQVQGNIASLVYAVAEKGADLIKGKVTTAN